jgi:hypothetical protein
MLLEEYLGSCCTTTARNIFVDFYASSDINVGDGGIFLYRLLFFLSCLLFSYRKLRVCHTKAPGTYFAKAS